MKKTNLLSAATCAVCLAGMHSNIALADGPYMELKLAATAPSTARDLTQVGQFDLNFKNGLSGSIAIGWAFDHMRSEIEGSIIGADFDLEDGTINQTITQGSVKTLMVNGYYDLTDDFIVTPYIGAGIGVSDTNLSTISTGKYFAGQAMAGFKYKASDHFWVGAEYRYMQTKTDGNLDDFKLSSFLATFTIGF